MCSPSLGRHDNSHIEHNKTTNRDELPEWPSSHHTSIECGACSPYPPAACIPGISNLSLKPWFEAPGNSAAAPQFHQVTHASSPLDFISSPLPAFSCKCYSAKVLRLPEHFWHRLLLLEGVSLDETGQVPSLAGAGKRGTAIGTLDRK